MTTSRIFPQEPGLASHPDARCAAALCSARLSAAPFSDVGVPSVDPSPRGQMPHLQAGVSRVGPLATHRVSGSGIGFKASRPAPTGFKMRRGVNRSRKLSQAALQARTALSHQSGAAETPCKQIFRELEALGPLQARTALSHQSGAAEAPCKQSSRTLLAHNRKISISRHEPMNTVSWHWKLGGFQGALGPLRKACVWTRNAAQCSI
jgi:hypothetical protein